MAIVSQQFLSSVLGTPTVSLGEGRVSWESPSNALVDSQLVEGGATAYIRYIAIEIDTPRRLVIRLSSADSGDGTDVGPDFHNNFETSGTLVFLVDGNTYTLNTGDDLVPDSEEPYIYHFSSGSPSETVTTTLFLAVYNAGTTLPAALTISADVGPTIDSQPTFGTGSVSNQSYIQNQAITTLQLPIATSGNTPLVYSISPALPTGLALDPVTRRITGTPTTIQDSTTYTYAVTDVDGDTDTLTFTITVVLPTNLIPTFGASTVDNQSYVLDQAISTLQLPTASGGDTPLIYSISPNLPFGLAFNANLRRITGTPSTLQDAATYTYTVTDNDNDTDALAFTIIVREAVQETNVIPSYQGEIVRMVITTGSLQTPLNIATGVGSFTGDNRVGPGLRVGRVRIGSADDIIGLNQQPGDTVSWAVARNAGGLVNGLYLHFLTATDPVVHTSTVIDGSTAAGAGYINVDFAATFSPPAIGELCYVVIATDTLDTGIPINLIPTAPVITDKTNVVGDTVSIVLPAASGGDPPLTYSVIGLPSGLAFNTTTRRVTGAPDTARFYSVTLVVTDTDGDVVESAFGWSIRPPVTPPVIPARGLSLLLTIENLAEQGNWNTYIADPTGPNRSGNLRTFSTSRSRLSSGFGGYAATKGSFHLVDDRTRWLRDSFLNGSRVRLSLADGSDIYYIYTGYIWEYDLVGFENYNHDIIDITCFDVFERFAQESIDIEGDLVIPAMGLHDFLHYLLDYVDWPRQWRDIEISQVQTVELRDLGNSSILELMREAERGASGYLFVSGSGVVKYRNHVSSRVIEETTPAITFDYSGEQGVVRNNLKRVQGGRQVANVVEVEVSDARVTIEDSRSATVYGKRVLNSKSRIVGTVPVARSMGLYRAYLADHGNRRVNVTVDVKLSHPEVLALEPADIVTVNLGLHGVTGKHIVEGTGIEYDANINEWVLRLEMLRSPLQSAWRLASSEDIVHEKGQLVDSAEDRPLLSDAELLDRLGRSKTILGV